MLTIKVLGPGCAKCHFLEQRTGMALADIKTEYPDVDAIIEKVTDIDAFMQYELMSTPGLVINEKLVCAGHIASKRKIVHWLQEALE